MIAGSIMFGAAFRVIGQTPEGIVIKCLKCAWFDAFPVAPLTPADGLRDGLKDTSKFGPRLYTEEEIQDIQHSDALADAEEQHRDHQRVARA